MVSSTEYILIAKSYRPKYMINADMNNALLLPISFILILLSNTD